MATFWFSLFACCLLALSTHAFAEDAVTSRYGLLRPGNGADSNCSCDTHPNVTTWFGRQICDAPLTLSWALAVLIGLLSACKLYSLGQNISGSLSYSITFAMYAAMITSGLIVHCLFLVECGKAPVTQAYITVAKIDGSLTSSIALSFIYDGLVDLKIIPERAIGTLLSMVLVYGAVFVAYFTDLMPAMNLYFLTITVGCSVYLVCQSVCLLTSHCRGFIFLILAGMVGGISLWLFHYHTCWLCQTLGAWSIEGVWYYGSDLAMLLISLYVWHTRTSSSMLVIGSNEDTDKSHYMKKYAI